MTARIYSTYFDNVTVAAVQDVFSLKAGTANGMRLHYVSLSAGGVTAAAEIRLRLKRMPATFTQGSGGSTPTVSAIDSGETKTSTATVHANDTTQGTTSGTAIIMAAWQWNVLGIFEFLPTPEIQPEVQATEGVVIDIPGAPASTVVSGTIMWEEQP